MLRRRPFGKESVRILIEVGKHIDTPIPCNALNIISSIPVLAKPDAKMNKLSKKHPVMLM